jgi:NF-X1-type zinc finger protein NFXL1
MPLKRAGGPTSVWTPGDAADVFSLEADAEEGSPDGGRGGGGGGGGGGRFADSVLQSYLQVCGQLEQGDGGAEDAAFADGVDRVREHLLGSSDGVAACLICLENIRPADPIWHCCGGAAAPSTGCYAVLHLVCVQSWARQQLGAAAAKAAAAGPPDRAAPPPPPPAWACPKCRHAYSLAEVPSGYRCYCGQESDPPFDPWNAPHSCGGQCNRQSPACGHPCVLLCHPGPCPPCPRVVHAACHCGALAADKRCGRHAFSCGAACGRRLGCGHACAEICHEARRRRRRRRRRLPPLRPGLQACFATECLTRALLLALPLQGPCPPCGLLSDVPCLCGGETKTLPCAQRGAFRCAAPCARGLLACGLHACERGCHAGASCGACPLSGPKACPCGKTRLGAASCDAAVPPCGQTCDKLLSCGAHRCVERCHAGPCPQTCRSKVEKTCGCGRTSRAVLCHEPVRCERRCGEMRGCGRHPCRRRCCDGRCPPCPEVCGRRLRCGTHFCPSPCHPGPCSPCPLTVKVACACGRTAYSVPCGRERAAAAPRCAHACPVPPLCRHAGALPPHRCHFGPCPGAPGAPLCPLQCGAPLECGRGHACGAPCHDPPPPAVADYDPPPAPPAPGEELSKRQAAELARRATPPAAAAAAAAAALRGAGAGAHTACPPCAVQLSIPCLGGHTQAAVACSVAAPFSCGAACARLLPCGNHACAVPCHDPTAEPCAPCALRCQRPRACGHACGLACHPAECPQCSVEVLLPCHCGRSSLPFACHEAAAGVAPGALRCGKVCARPLPRCTHLCAAACHPGACAAAGGACAEEVSVRCACKRLKRKLPCSEVAALLRRGGVTDGSYDATTQMRLLPCTAECAAAAAKPAPPPPPAPPPASAAAEASNAAASAPPPPARKLTRQEREQQREAREREKAAAAARRRLARRVLLALLVAAVMGGGLGVLWVIASADRWAKGAWGDGEL